MSLFPYFGDLFQASYVAKDRDRAVELAQSQMGVDNFVLFDSQAPVLSGGKVQTLSLRVAVANIGRHQFEIIQPVSGPTHIYTDGMDMDGRVMSFHHLALAVTGSYSRWEEALRQLRASGNEIAFLSPAEPVDKPMACFAYVDTRKTLGHYTEYLWWAPELNGNPAFPNFGEEA